MPPRIGLLLLGHPDYPNDIGLRFAQQAVEGLARRGVEVLFEQRPLTHPLQAREAAIRLTGHNPDGTLVFLGTWIECPTALAAIRETEHLPFALWSFGMFAGERQRESTGSFVAGAVLKGALDRMRYRAPSITGLPDDQTTLDRIATFCRAAHAVQRLKRTRMCLIGYAAMGMYAGTFDHALLRRHIGPEVEHLDTYTLVRTAESLAEAEVLATADELRRQATVNVAEARLLKSARLAAALRRIVREGRYDAVNVKCQHELSQQYGMTACLPVSLIAEDGIVAACEGDVLVTVTECLLAYLTEEGVCYGDLLDLQGNRILLSSCGFAPFSLCNPAEQASICELGYPGFDGIISSFTLRRGRVTFARLAEGSRGDYRLIYGTGTGVETELRQGRFPALEVMIDGDPQRLQDTLASQHFALCYGDVSTGLEDVCRWLGAETVRI